MPAYTYQESIAALFVGALGTGMYLCTLAYALRWQLFIDQGWKLRKNVDYRILFTTLSLFVLSSVHLGLATLLTVVWADNAVKHLPTSDVVPWPATVMCSCANSSVLIADGYLIYRCWVVCSRSWKSIVFPSLFWLGGTACTGIQIYWQVVKGDNNTSAWTPVNMSVGPGTVLTPFWASTIIINLYTTGRIVYCIWTSAKNHGKESGTGRDLRFAMRVLLDSGMLYLFITIPHFIVWWTNNSGAILVLAWLNLPVVCSAFNLIIIRTSQHRASGKELQYQNGVMSTMRFQRPKTIDIEAVEEDFDHRDKIDEQTETTVSIGGLSQ